MRARRTLSLCVGVFLCALPVYSQGASTLAADEPGTGVDNGVDPLYFRHLVQLEQRVFGADEQDIDKGYRTLFRADWAVTRRDIFRLVLPYDHLEFNNGESTTDFGDMRLRFLRKVDRRSSEHYADFLGFGLDLVIPTGDLEDRTGGAQWSVAPVLMFSAYPGHGVAIVPAVQFTKSISHDESDAPEVAELLVSSLFSWNRPHWWIAAEPEVIVDFDGDDATSYALRFQAGVQLSRKFALLAGLGTTLGGSSERFDNEALLSLRFLP